MRRHDSFLHSGLSCNAWPGLARAAARVRRRSRLPVAFGLVLLLGFLCRAARAQQDNRIADFNGKGMDLHLFRPPVDSRGMVSMNGASVLGHNTVSLSMFIDYGSNFMPLADGHGTEHLADHAFAGAFSVSYGLFDRLLLGLSAPVTLTAGDDLVDVGPSGQTDSYKPFNEAALGHIALHVKLRVLRPTEVIGLAVLAQAGYAVMEAAPRSMSAEPGFFYWPQVVVEKVLIDPEKPLRLVANAGYRGHTGDNPSFGVCPSAPAAGCTPGAPQLESGLFEYSGLVTAGFGVSYRVASPLDLVLETYLTQQVGGSSNAKQRLSAEAVGGIKLFVEGSSFLMIAGGFGYTPGFQSPDQRAILGFVFEPPVPDSDGDGIPDYDDDCPYAPEDQDGYQDTKEDSPPGQYGCPDPDNDGDGIPDISDDCPDTKEDLDGKRDDDGCPDAGDRDGDGIPDDVDKCPDEPENFNGQEDKDGCPEGVKLIRGDKEILANIQFATGSARILPESMPDLDAVVRLLKQHPEFLVIAVEGHADERGKDQDNLNLTQLRANAVVKTLAERGISRDRLGARGYGEICPRDPRSSPRAWERNRRVEFKIVRTTKGPTDVELGCEKARERGVKP